MKNYKNIRQKPYIYGFSVVGFFSFAIGGICALMSFMSGFSFLKIITVIIFIGLLYIFSKYILSNKEFASRIFDNKLPNKYSEYE
jgi:hypothetical protein